MAREAGRLPQDVPAGDVHWAFDVRVAAEDGVHVTIEDVEVARVEADELRADLFQPGADAAGVGREVGRAERARFPPARDPGVGLDGDDGRIEHLDEVAVGPGVAAFLQRKVDLPGEDTCDLHGARGGWRSVVKGRRRGIRGSRGAEARRSPGPAGRSRGSGRRGSRRHGPTPRGRSGSRG